jgi:hypothetical protein
LHFLPPQVKSYLQAAFDSLDEEAKAMGGICVALKLPPTLCIMVLKRKGLG